MGLWGERTLPKGNPPVRLSSVIYQAWLAENPKNIEGGPVEFESVEDSLDPNMVIFPAHLVETAELPSAYANKLMIFGYPTEYDGFQLWVTPEGYDYLLMAHHRHLSGDFVDQNGVKHKDCPHFHELDLKKPWKKGEPSTKRIVCQGLAKGMPAIDLIEKFLTYYYFDDGREGDLARPIKNYTSQRKINEPW